MTFQRLNQFHCDDPAKLDRELNALEDNISRETASIRASCAPRPAIVRVVASASAPTVAVLFDQQVTLDTSVAAGVAVLPPLSPANFGRRAVIVCPSPSNTRKVACQREGDTVDLSTLPQSIGAGVTEVFCDASGYWLK